MYAPTHPGEIIRHDCLAPLGLTVIQAAAALIITRQTLSRLLNGQTGVSAEMAICLSKAFSSSPEQWLRLQLAFNMSQLRDKAGQIHVQRCTPTYAANP